MLALKLNHASKRGPRFRCDKKSVKPLLLTLQGHRSARLKMLRIACALLFMTSLFEDDSILVSSERIHMKDAHGFSEHGSGIYAHIPTMNDSDDYTSTPLAKPFDVIDKYRRFYLQNYNREYGIIKLRTNYNITHIPERAFEWANDVLVSGIFKLRNYFQTLHPHRQVQAHKICVISTWTKGENTFWYVTCAIICLPW